MPTTTTDAPETARYRVTGMDCPSCAAKIEKATRAVGGVEEVKVSIASQIMTLRLDDPDARLPEIERTITGLGYQLDRLDRPARAEGGDVAAHAGEVARRELATELNQAILGEQPPPLARC